MNINREDFANGALAIGDAIDITVRGILVGTRLSLNGETVHLELATPNHQRVKVFGADVIEWTHAQ